MNVNLLIDNIVRQTTVLIAQLATSAGGRAQLDSVASRVFLDLVRELKSQGLGNKVIADMFGLALRTYHDRVRRLSESVTDRGTSLWSAVLKHVQDKGLVTRAELLRRFHADDEPSVRGVLKDLVESGLVFRAGRGDRTTFRVAAEHELTAMHQGEDRAEATARLIWVVLHQLGCATAAELQTRANLGAEELEHALALLVSRGNARETDGAYVADSCVIALGSEHGWEAAVFDHYQALVSALVAKMSRGERRSDATDAIGGSTYHFDLYPGHPLEREVLGFLTQVRSQASALRARVDVEAVPLRAPTNSYRVVFYAGQNVLADAETLTRLGDTE